MSNDLRYEQSIIAFQKKRHDLLELLAKVMPNTGELHKRQWRSQQLDNALFDIKETVGACNLQLDEEKAQLEDYQSETDRLRAMNTKLKEDVKILEGVTGMKGKIPEDIDDPIYDQIITTSSEFRENFAIFYENLAAIKQEIPIDAILERNSKVLVETLQDCISLTFDSRSESAFLSKEATEKTEEIKMLEKELNLKEIKLQNDLENARKKIEESTERMLQAIEEQGIELRKEGRRIEEEYAAVHNELRKNLESLNAQERDLKYRCKNMRTYNDSLKENMRRRMLELELELDTFEKRIDSIKKNPHLVDQRLINLSLLLSKKSALLDQAIGEMRNEVSSFSMWIDQFQ